MPGLKTKVSIKMPDLSLDQPDQTLFRAAALETKKRIRVRTETDKKDYLGKAFKGYTAEYKKKRIEGKISKPGGGFYGARSGTPNLSLSTKMLGSMRTLFTKSKGTVTLSGEEALKARGNEARGRIFFAFHETDRDKVLSLVTNWMTKKNKLKR